MSKIDLKGATPESWPPQIQQAQKPVQGSQFLQIVAKRTKRREHKLTRVAFRVSRLMEFCTEKELVNQTGHPVQEWPLVLVKELFDNALDAAEESEVPPEIEIIVAKDGTITITDNANGIATETIEAVLDYSIRVSSREAYVSPTRGAQGNALKTILAMTYVLDRENDYNREINAEAVGVTIIETRGQLHCIEFRVDHVNSQPKLTHTVTPATAPRPSSCPSLATSKSRRSRPSRSANGTAGWRRPRRGYARPRTESNGTDSSARTPTAFAAGKRPPIGT